MKRLIMLKKLHSEQSGFTILELIVALAILGVIYEGLAATFPQILSINDANNAHIIAVSQVQNAIDNINGDIQMAQTITATGNTRFPMVLSWVSWNADKTVPQLNCSLTYSIDGQGNMQRQYVDSGGGSSSKIVARYISSLTADSGCSYDSTNHKLSLHLTAIVSFGSKTARETRELSIIPRPGS